MKINHFDLTSEELNILYNRPINPLSFPSISIIGSSDKGLANLNEIYEVAGSLNCRVSTVLLGENQNIGELSEVVHIDPNAKQVAILEVISMIGNSSLSLIGCDFKLTSANHIVVAKALESSLKSPIILSGEALKIISATSHQLFEQSNLALACNTIELVKLINDLSLAVKTSAQRGVFQITDYLQALATIMPNLRIIVFEHERMFFYSALEPDQVYVVAGSFIAPAANSFALAAILAILAWPTQDLSNFCTRASLGGYLAANSWDIEQTSRLANIKQKYRQYINS